MKRLVFSCPCSLHRFSIFFSKASGDAPSFIKIVVRGQLLPQLFRSLSKIIFICSNGIRTLKRNVELSGTSSNTPPISKSYWPSIFNVLPIGSTSPKNVLATCSVIIMVFGSARALGSPFNRLNESTSRNSASTKAMGPVVSVLSSKLIGRSPLHTVLVAFDTSG